MIFPNLSVAEIVVPCSVEVESSVAVSRQEVEAVEHRGSQTKTQSDQVRSEAIAVEVATRSESALYRMASDTSREHRTQERRLEPALLTIEQQLESVLQTVEQETRAAVRRCRAARDQISVSSHIAERLRLSVQTVFTSQQLMESLRDEAEEMLDGLRAITRRQQE